MAGGALDIELLRGLPAEMATLRIRTRRRSAERTFRGPTLHHYARVSGLLGAHSGDRFPACYFLVTANDGFQVALSFAEVLPSSTDRRVLLAYEQDGEPLTSGMRLVVPGDDLGGRSVIGVATVETGEIPQGDPAPAGRLELGGLVAEPGAVEVEAWDADAEATVPAQRVHGHDNPPRQYLGRRVYDVVDSAGFTLDPANEEDILRKLVVVWSADGTPSVLTGGEIHPEFFNGNALLATRREGERLAGDEGPVRLVIPYDRNPGRWVKQVARVEVRNA
jgi:hypothetical protein